MKKKNNATDLPVQQADPKRKTRMPGHSVHLRKKAISVGYKAEEGIHPKKTSPIKPSNGEDEAETDNKEDFNEDESGREMSVPATEADDELENSGSDDEENAYYIQGEYDNNDLDENIGNKHASRYSIVRY